MQETSLLHHLRTFLQVNACQCFACKTAGISVLHPLHFVLDHKLVSEQKRQHHSSCLNDDSFGQEPPLDESGPTSIPHVFASDNQQSLSSNKAVATREMM